MIVGLMIITRWTRLGAYIASVWLLLIAINLVAGGNVYAAKAGRSENVQWDDNLDLDPKNYEGGGCGNV
jgi:hypothetical protein